ncbi:MAG: hypothetical protein M1829_003263 [Trizodia sp. TS-e1964]|nr:MAG: hypothetical protein M1829_003263 [Trizodia sp. TS-e1964]
MAQWILTSPASRGIGFALTRHLLQTTTLPIVATARTYPPAARRRLLEGLDNVNPARLNVLHLDVTEETTIAAAAEEVKRLFPTEGASLRLAFAVPGILHPEKAPAQIEYADALRTLQINTLGPLMLMKHFAPFLPRKRARLQEEEGVPPHAVWANMSARVGSISDNRLGGWFSYRASKAGVNAATKAFDIYLRNSAGENAMAVALHPGTVKTELSREFWGSAGKMLEPEEAAARLVGVVNGLGVQRGRGRCWGWDGVEIPP